MRRAGCVYISPALNIIVTNADADLISVWSVVGSGLIAAVLVTAGVYVFGLSETIVGTSKVSRRVSKQSAGYYDGQYSYGGHYGGQHQYGGHEDRWGRRQEGVSHQLAKIMAALSVDSVQVGCDNHNHD